MKFSLSPTVTEIRPRLSELFSPQTTSGPHIPFKKWSQIKSKRTLQMQNFTLYNFTINENFSISDRYGDTTPFIRTFPISTNFWSPNPLKNGPSAKCKTTLQCRILRSTISLSIKFSLSPTVTEIRPRLSELSFFGPLHAKKRPNSAFVFPTAQNC